MVVVDIWCYVLGSDKQRQCFRIRARPTDTIYDLKKRIAREQPLKAIRDSSQIQLYKYVFFANAEVRGRAKQTTKPLDNSTATTSSAPCSTNDKDAKSNGGAIESNKNSAGHALDKLEYRSRPLDNRQLTSEVLPELFQIESIRSQQKCISLCVGLHEATFKLYNSKVGIIVGIQQNSMDALKQYLLSEFVKNASATQTCHNSTNGLADNSSPVYIVNQQHGQVMSVDQLRESQIYTVIIGQDAWQQYSSDISSEHARLAQLDQQIARMEHLNGMAEKLLKQLNEPQIQLNNSNFGNKTNSHTLAIAEAESTSPTCTATSLHRTGILADTHDHDSLEGVITLQHEKFEELPDRLKEETVLVPDSLRGSEVITDEEETEIKGNTHKRSIVQRICSTPPKRIRSNSVSQLMAKQALEEARQAAAAAATIAVNERSKNSRKARHTHSDIEFVRHEPRLRHRYPQVDLNDVFGHNAANQKANMVKSKPITLHRHSDKSSIQIEKTARANGKAESHNYVSVDSTTDEDDNMSDTTNIPTPPGMREFLELRDARLEQGKRKGLIMLSDIKFPVNAPGCDESLHDEQHVKTSKEDIRKYMKASISPQKSKSNSNAHV
ncbi:hypothetical protein BDF19DRAFT_446561 [Syncephalis fuscata]|nr:hypothetical protein BDF19DRAFT_446561 [Syncephalis fuscata]